MWNDRADFADFCQDGRDNALLAAIRRLPPFLVSDNDPMICHRVS